MIHSSKTRLAFRSFRNKITNKLAIRDLRNINNRLSTPFFIVLMPGCLHIANLCLSLIPEDVDIVLIDNGLDSFEKKWIKYNYSRHPVLYLHQMMLPHHVVIDRLIDTMTQPFGLMDYDCFVLNPDLFYKMREIKEDVSFQACFAYCNDVLNITIPETFFIFLNRDILNSLRMTLNVGSAPAEWQSLSDEIKKNLIPLGIDGVNYPEAHKKNFDTLRLLMALCLAKGYKFNFISKISCEEFSDTNVVHIGGVSQPNYFKEKWKFRGNYFWRRLLETQCNISLRDHYERKYGRLSSQQLLTENPDFTKQIGNEFFVLIDKMINLFSKQEVLK